MSDYKYLLFDLDGTLFDMNAVEISALKESLKQNSLEYTDEIFKTYSAINEQLWKEFEIGNLTKAEVRFKRFEILINDYFKSETVDIKKLADTYFRLFSKTVFAYEGVTDLLENLAKKYKLYVVSNGSTDVQYYKLNKLDLSKYFQKIFLSEEIGFAKPNYNFFEYVHNALGHPDKKDVIVIGDSISADIEGGNNFGYDACYVGTLHCSIATYAVSNITDISNFF